MENIPSQVVIIAVCAFGGIVSFLAGWRSRQRNLAAAGWPTVRGTIVKSDVEFYVSRDDDSGRETRMYRPEITYEYQVSGQTYTSKQVRVNELPASNSERRERKKLEAYPVGGSVEVHYNPDNTEDALLEISTSRINLAMIIGIILGLVAIYYAYQYLMV